MSKLLQFAFTELGVKETPGSQHTQRILDYSHESGLNWVNTDETPWCSIFVNWVCMKMGAQRSGAANARSWLNVGTSKASPEPGDIVVFWRNNPHAAEGHVAFFLGYSKDNSKIYCLGGNQGNAVSIAAYDTNRVLSFRSLGASGGSLQVPKPILKKGDNNAEVKKLQEALNSLGYNCGNPDSDFGDKTDKALKKFQTDHGLSPDGVYGNITKNKLESELQS